MDAELRDRACDRAYRDHAPDVYRVAYGILRDPDEALDATHDATTESSSMWPACPTSTPPAGETSQPASITVYDTQTGGVRLIAAKLGKQLLTFPEQVLP